MNEPNPSARTRRPRLILIAAVSAVVLVAVLIRRQADGTGPRPVGVGFNVVVITLDTVRADHVGVYGREGAVTPTIDALADGGIRFDDAVSCAPVTLPAHASLFTGLYPFHHGVRNNGDSVLGSENQTLAEVLSDEGYATAAFPSAIVLDSRYALDQGFEVYDDSYALNTTSATFGGKLERTATDVTDAALAWLGKRDERPFLLWVHYYDAHFPYGPPREFAPVFRTRPYDGEIAYVDTQVARLMKDLDRRGLSESTIVVVVGDHGEGRADHGETFHGCLIYDSVMHIPLIMSCPGLLHRRIVDDRVVSIVDVLPTLLETLGIDHAGRVDGRDLLGEDVGTGRAVYMESVYSLRNHGWAPLFALRSHDDKFILAPAPEFYDLRSDPGEKKNLWSASPERSAELERRLEDVLGGTPTIESLLHTVALDPETSANLAALGYGGGRGNASDGSLGQLDPKDVIRVTQMVEESRRYLANARGPTASFTRGEALSRVQAALDMSPRDREALQQLARVHIASGKLREAESALRRFIEIKPSSDVYVMLAQILAAGLRYDEADAILLAAEELEPTHGGIFTARGDALLARRRFDEAIASYRHAIAIDPHRATGSARRKLQRAESARAAERR